MTIKRKRAVLLKSTTPTADPPPPINQGKSANVSAKSTMRFCQPVHLTSKIRFKTIGPYEVQMHNSQQGDQKIEKVAKSDAIQKVLIYLYQISSPKHLQKPL